MTLFILSGLLFLVAGAGLILRQKRALAKRRLNEFPITRRSPRIMLGASIIIGMTITALL